LSFSDFPRNIGLVFIDTPTYVKSRFGSKWKKKEQLNFDSDACAYFILQMNSIQGTFDYQVIAFDFDRALEEVQRQDIVDWFDEEVKNFESTQKTGTYKIDYWIGITSKNVGKNWFFQTRRKDDAKSGKFVGIITSDTWEKEYSPPSLFEYLSITVSILSMYALNDEFKGKIYEHSELKTKGCIFDFTRWKADRRIMIANPNLCAICRERMSELNEIIEHKTKYYNLLDDVKHIISRKWMGSLDLIDSPIFNLNKLYRYNIDRNSGFNKGFWEKMRDSIVEKTAEWTIGTVITAVITGIVGFFLYLLFGTKT
jgi:hypothetical protein